MTEFQKEFETLMKKYAVTFDATDSPAGIKITFAHANESACEYVELTTDHNAEFCGSVVDSMEFSTSKKTW